jgi:hypothetical protein
MLRFPVVDGHDELSLARLHDDGLFVHAAHHVKRGTGLSPQRKLQHVLLDALLDDRAKFVLYLKVTVRRTQSADTLMGAPKIVIRNPEFGTLAG